MKLRLEADSPEEVREKSKALIKALQGELSDAAPEVAAALEKALPRKEQELKYPVLRALQKKTSDEYSDMLTRMLLDIGRVLDQGVAEKSEAAGLVFVNDPADLSKGWLCGICGAVGPDESCEHVQTAQDNLSKALYLGPRGGKWADPQHTIPWDPDKHGKQIGLALSPQAKKAPEPEPDILDVVANDPALTDEQRKKPESKALKQAKAIVDRGITPEDFELPAGARIDDSWEPPVAGEDDPWNHPDYGEGKGAAPWHDSDWAPELKQYDILLINSSGGKDSQAMLARLVALADKQGYPRDQIVVVHADLGRVDWEGAATLAQEQAEHYGLRFELVKRQQNDLVEQIEERHGDLVQKERDVATMAQAGITTWGDMLDTSTKDLLKIIGEGKGESKWPGEHRAKMFHRQVKKKLEKLSAQHAGRIEALARRIDKLQVSEENAKTDKQAQKISRKIREVATELAGLQAAGDPKDWPIDFGKTIPWPSMDARFCTSDHKRAEIKKLITAMGKQYRDEHDGQKPKVLNCMGIRAQESSGRRKQEDFRREEDISTRTVDRWYPIHRWEEGKVWDTIAESEVPYHKAYKLGMRRLSCVFCVFATREDLLVAAWHNPELFKAYLELEEKIGFSFSPNVSLAEVAAEIRKQRDAGNMLSELAEWVKKALGLDSDADDLVKAVLIDATVTRAHLVVLLLEAALVRLRKHSEQIECVTIEWKENGVCVHLDTVVNSHHVAYLEYPEAYNASLAVAAFAQKRGLGFEEHNAPEPLDDEQLADGLEKALYIGPRGGRWADPEHTIPYDEKKHGRQLGMDFTPKEKPFDPQQLIQRGMSLATAEDLIQSQPVEHLVVLIDGQVTHHAVGAEDHCDVSPLLAQYLREQLFPILTHNHPTNSMLSLDDIVMAINLNLHEVRAVGIRGTIYKMTRPPSGWLQSQEQADAMLGLLRGAQFGASLVARERMDNHIMAEGGEAGDMHDPAFSQEVFNEWFSEEFYKQLNTDLETEGYGFRVEIEQAEARKSLTDERGNADEWDYLGQGLASEVHRDRLEKTLYIGPRGGRWADPEHTIPYDEKKHGKQVGFQFDPLDKPKDKTPDDIGPGMSIAEAEEIIRTQPIEHFLYYGKDGLVHKAKGVEDHVEVTPELTRAIDDDPNAICIHNHPGASESCFSTQDIMLTILLDVAEARVVTPNKTYRLIRPKRKKGWGDPNSFVLQHQLATLEKFAQRQTAADYRDTLIARGLKHGDLIPDDLAVEYNSKTSDHFIELFNRVLKKKYGWKILVEDTQLTLKSEDWIELDTDAGEALWFNLEKAGTKPHKYIRRVPYVDAKGRRRYRYYYKESALARGAREGEEIRLGDQVVRIVKIHPNGDISIQDAGADSKKVVVTERVKAGAWAERLAGHLGDKYYEAVEKRARQAVNAVLKHVPRKLLADLQGDTDEARLEDLRTRVPEVYERLQKAFQRAGINPFEAKRILKNSLERRGWEPEARAAVIGNVLTLEGARLAKRHREVLDAAENLAGGSKVGPEHAQAAVELAQSNIGLVARRAESELVRLHKLLVKAQDDPTDMGKKAAVLAGSIAAKAVEQLNALATAFPGLVDRAIPVARDTMLQVPAVAPEPPKREGSTANMFVAGEGGKPVALKAKYKLVEAEEIIPSHDPSTFARNPEYPEDLQERAYHRDESEQAKVIRNALGMKTAFVVNTNVDAINGPPIVMKNGVVLGGNSRTMSMQRVFADKDMVDKAEEMRQYLRDHAYEFGLTPEDIDAMKNPVLIREVDIEDQSQQNLQIMVRAMNESFIQSMDPRTKQVAMGRRLSERSLELLAENMGEDETLAAFLDTGRARPFIEALYKAGIIDERNQNQYTKRGRLNADGKVMVARILAGRVLDDADLLSDTPHNLVESIAKSVPFMLQALKAGEEYDLRETFRVALDAFNELKHMESEKEIQKLGSKLTDDQLNVVLSKLMANFRTDIQEDHPVMADPRAQAVLEIFIRRSGAKQMSAVFREFARLSAGKPAQEQQGFAIMADTTTPDQLIRVAIQAADDRAQAERAARAEKRRQKIAAEAQKLLEQQQKEADEKAQGPGLFASMPDGDLEKGGPYLGPRGGRWADPEHTIPWDPEVHGKAAKPKDPLRSYLYGGIPSGGGFKTNKELEVAAQRASEAAHCLLGSLGRHLGKDSDWKHMVATELAHIKEELGIIVKVVDEYARPVYTEQINNPTKNVKPDSHEEMEKYARDAVTSIREASPKLRALAAKLREQLKQQTDIPPEVLQTADLTYRFLEEMTTALLESVKHYPEEPITNPFKSLMLRAVVRKLQKAVDTLIEWAGETEKAYTAQDEPLADDFTKPIHDRDNVAYNRVKAVLTGKGYQDLDFEEGGPFYGWSVNQLIDLARDKRAS